MHPTLDPKPIRAHVEGEHAPVTRVPPAHYVSPLAHLLVLAAVSLFGAMKTTEYNDAVGSGGSHVAASGAQREPAPLGVGGVPRRQLAVGGGRWSVHT